MPTTLTSAKRASQKLRSVLIPLDLGPGSERVTARAALLPLHDKATLILTHVVPKLLPPGTRSRIVRDARDALNAAADRLATQIPSGVAIKQVVKAGSITTEITHQAQASKSDLIVMGRGAGRAVEDVFLGSTSERVIRKGRLPVLVVRLPAHTPYKKPLLATDLDPIVHELVSFTLRVLPAPRPPMAWVYAFDAPYLGLIYTSLPLERVAEYKEHHRVDALQQMEKLFRKVRAGSDAVQRWKWETIAQYGSPRVVIDRAVSMLRTDLLILGTHGYSGVAHAFLGSVAGDVLRQVPCDVLVVPPRRR